MGDGTLVFISNDNKYLTTHAFKYSFLLQLSPCLQVQILGDTNASITKTAVLFGTLENFEEKPWLAISLMAMLNFDYACSEQLARLFDGNPTKKVSFSSNNRWLPSGLLLRPGPHYGAQGWHTGISCLAIRFSSKVCGRTF